MIHCRCGRGPFADASLGFPMRTMSRTSQSHGFARSASRPRRRHVSSVRGGCLAVALCLCTLPASAEILRARYAVSLVGLRIGDAAATSLIDRARYRINLNAQLTGLAAMISNLKLALASTGNFRKGAVAPQTYATTSASSKETRTVRMALDAGTVRALDISPPFDDKEGRIPVTSANKRNILDPSSALIMAVPDGQPLVGPAACNRRIPVFDGYMRFDLSMSFVGTRDVAVKGYSGPVSVCAVRYIPIAGHKPDSRSTRFMAENREIEAWLAPVERARVVVPFHVALKTLAGSAVIDAVEFSVEPQGTTSSATN
jgi:hypothetical protein